MVILLKVKNQSWFIWQTNHWQKYTHLVDERVEFSKNIHGRPTFKQAIQQDDNEKLCFFWHTAVSPYPQMEEFVGDTWPLKPNSLPLRMVETSNRNLLFWGENQFSELLLLVSGREQLCSFVWTCLMIGLTKTLCFVFAAAIVTKNLELTWSFGVTTCQAAGASFLYLSLPKLSPWGNTPETLFR